MLKRLLNKASDSIFIQSVAKLAGGTSLAHLVTILISPLLTRLYPVDSFGELQLFHSSVIIGSIIITGAYEFAIVIPKKNSSAASLLSISISLAFIFSASVFVLFFFTKDQFSQIFNVSTLFLFLFPAVLFINSSLNIFQYWYLRAGNYVLLSKVKITQSSSIAFSQSTFGFYGLTEIGLFIGYSLGRLLALMLFLIKLGKRFWNHIKNLSFAVLKSNAYAFRDQPRFSVISTLLSTGGIEVPILLISTFFGQLELGFYALAYRVLSAPSALIGNSVGQVFYKQAADRISDKKPLLSKLLNTWSMLAIIAFFPMLVLYLYSEPIFVFIFGDSWRLAGTVTTILTPLLFIDFLSAPTGKTLILINRQRNMTVFSSLIFTARVSGLTIGYYFRDFYFGLQLLVLLHIVVLVSYNIFLYIKIRDYDQEIHESIAIHN